MNNRLRTKTRHAIALVLVGWFLMLPPVSRDYPKGNVEAPLTQWRKRPTTYRDKDECEHVLDRYARVLNGRNRQVAVRYYKQAQCVSTDDPRLKK